MKQWKVAVGEIGKISSKVTMWEQGYFDDLEATTLSTRQLVGMIQVIWVYQDSMDSLHVGQIETFMKLAGEMVSLCRVEKCS